jgi:predicted nuclease with TOPRIM domain
MEKDEEEISLNSKNFKNKSPITSHNSDNIESLNENEHLKKENTELRSKLEGIDKKFDKLASENNELRSYIKDKSDNLDEMKVMLNCLLTEMTKMKGNTSSSSRIYSAKKEESVIINTNEAIECLQHYSIQPTKHDIPKLNLNV